MTDLISVVVPVYNVKKYLQECVDSLIKQTYSNIEILLIDDGSTDGSSELCDQIEKQDSRIRVIHKTNGGLSDARNNGIEVARGSYISFIDSDDFVAPNYFEVLYNAITKNNADLAMCGFERFKDEDIVDGIKTQSSMFVNIQKNEEVLRNVLYQIEQNVYSVAAPCKLYKVSNFKTLRFPVGKLNEDMAIIIEIMEMNSKIAVVHSNLYFYRINPNSITQQKFNKRRMDVIEISEKIMHKVSKRFPSLENAAKSTLYSRSFEMLTIAYNSTNKNEFIKEKEKLKHCIKTTRKDVLFDKYTRVTVKISSLLSFFSIRFVTIILSYIRKKRYEG